VERSIPSLCCSRNSNTLSEARIFHRLKEQFFGVLEQEWQMATRQDKGPRPADIQHEHTVLLLQGGGALGAYQAGVYEGMHDHGLAPDWVTGVSIGAINAALIAGNPRTKGSSGCASSGTGCPPACRSWRLRILIRRASPSIV